MMTRDSDTTTILKAPTFGTQEDTTLSLQVNLVNLLSNILKSK